MRHHKSIVGKNLRRLAPLACLLGGAFSTSAEIIYQENFSGSPGDPLGGRPPTLRSGIQGGSAAAIWTGPDPMGENGISADGSLRMQAKFAVGASAFLPFTPTTGMVYKLTVGGIHVPNGDWVGAGFSTAAQPDGNKRFRDAGSVFWGLARSETATLNDQTFSGPEISGADNSTALSSSSITILIDATSARSWVVRWFLDGHEVRGGKFQPQPVTHVGFGFNSNASATGDAGASSVASLILEGFVPDADDDDDGLSDKWEQTHFRANPGDPVAETLGHYTGSADPDSDGYTNFEEFVGGSAPRQSRSTPLDTNGDRLVDAWQRHHFGAIDSFAAKADADGDQDGFTNLQEQESGSNPRDALSKPATKGGSVAARAAATLDVARTGADVFLAWTLPPGVIRQVELYRNSRADTEGRTLLAKVSPPTCVFLDQVPDAAATYWYWLEIPGVDGSSASYGPFIAKAAKVWQP